MATAKPSIKKQINRQAQRLLTTGRRFERFDQLRQRHFWSSCFYTPDANGYIVGQRQLFITPPGQNGQGFPAGVALTERETNWKSANRVPDNQNFEVTELGVTVGVVPSEVYSADGTTPQVPAGLVANALTQNSILSITYLTNSVPLGLSADFAQASGPDLGTYVPLNNNATGNDPRFATNGFAAPALRRRMKIPILLQHGETFSFTLDLPRAVYVGPSNPLYVRVDFYATESFVEKS
jgi:hypothetical protein